MIFGDVGGGGKASSERLSHFYIRRLQTDTSLHGALTVRSKLKTIQEKDRWCLRQQMARETEEMLLCSNLIFSLPCCFLMYQ